MQNWRAAFSVPLVYLGWARDFWVEFDRYVEIERDLGSTFFFIPYKNDPGERIPARVRKRRAARYEVAAIKKEVHGLVSRGCEVGLHGIDAWHDSQKGSNELDRIREVTGQLEVGVRIHWLYFTEISPRALEEAGFSYDSSFGYNDMVGFRAGTIQAFCPPTTETLLELPLSIQDTAMFYSRRMNLSEAAALDWCKHLIQVSSVFGGALVLNWHTRSLSPERLWGDFYMRLLQLIRAHAVWFGTAGEIVKWFRKRRALNITQVEFSEDHVRLKLAGPPPNGQPAFVVRIYHPRFTVAVGRAIRALIPAHRDIRWNGEGELEITL